MATLQGLGHLNLASQAMIPGMPPIVVTAVVMPNAGVMHNPIQQLQHHKRLRSHATPLSVEEALHAARLEGLTLHAAPSIKTGFKGVSRGGKSSKKPFQAVRGQHSLGYYATAEEAALTYARFIAQEERQEQIAGGGDLKPKRERKHSGKITRWTPGEEELLRTQVNDLGSTGHWTEIATRLGTERTAAGVDQHWQIMCGRRKRRRTLKDDQKEGGALSEVNPGDAPLGSTNLLALGMSSSSAGHGVAPAACLRPLSAEVVPMPPLMAATDVQQQAVEPRAAAVEPPCEPVHVGTLASADVLDAGEVGRVDTHVGIIQAERAAPLSQGEVEAAAGLAAAGAGLPPGAAEPGSAVHAAAAVPMKEEEEA